MATQLTQQRPRLSGVDNSDERGPDYSRIPSEDSDAGERNVPKKKKGDAKRKPMTEAQLVRVIEDRESKADLARMDKEYYGDALDYYMGQPNGEELPDRSSIVMMELYSVIEWIKPALARIFFGGPSVVKFTAKSEDDVEQARQETDYINHVLLDQNNGFTVLMNWFTDAMLSRNAYVFAYWDKRIDTTESQYTDIDLESLALLMQGKDMEITKASARKVPGPDGIVELYTVSVLTREPAGKVCIDTVPPERVRVDRNHRHVDLADCPFVEYYEDKTISELREAGFEVEDDIVDDDQDEGYAASVNDRRVGITGISGDGDETDGDDADPASREVTVRTVFMRVDFDGDGIAELRRVVMVGRTIMYNEPDDIVALACITPTLVPHRHTGMGVYDSVRQLQDLKTQLARGMVDNTHLANNGRWFITDNVNEVDLLNGRPNAPVRVDGETVVGQAQAFNHPVLGNQIIATLEYADSVLENWTGASPRSLQGQTFDGNSINKTASGLSQIMSAALARIELIARIFSETGIKDLFRIVHALTLKHDRKEHIVELRGSWVPVDPQSWDKRDSLSVDTGLGTGDTKQRVGTLQALITAQTSMMDLGLTDKKRLYNALGMLTEEMGYKNVNEFWLDPDESENQPQGVEGLPPKQREAIVKQIADMAKAQADAQVAQIRDDGDKRKLDADIVRAVIAQQTSENTSFLNAQVDLAKASMQSDDKLIEKGASVQDDGSVPPEIAEVIKQLIGQQQAATAKKTVRHNRDAAGRIISSELISE